MAAHDDLAAFATQLGIEPDDELLPLAMNVPLSAAWREHRDARGQAFFHCAALGRSSWTHPRRDAFLQRYIALKIDRELDERARPQLAAALARVAGGGAAEAERELLLGGAALSAELLAALDTAGPGVQHGALLQACQLLAQPVVNDLDHLRSALRRGVAQNEELERQLEARRLELEALEHRNRAAKTQLTERNAGRLPSPRCRIGRVRRPDGMLAGAAPAAAEAVELTLSESLTLLEVAPAGLGDWARGSSAPEEAPESLMGSSAAASGRWAMPDGESDDAAWTGTNTWREA